MSLADTYLEAIQRTAEIKGQAQADAARNRGAIIGHSLESLGQIVPQIQQARQQQQDRAALDQDRIAQTQERGLNTQLLQAKLGQEQAAQSGQQLLNNAAQHHTNADGTPDWNGISAELTASGRADLGDIAKTKGVAFDEALSKAHAAKLTAAEADQRLASGIGEGMQAMLDAGAPIEDVAGYGLKKVQTARDRGLIPPEDAATIAEHLNPQNPDQVKGQIAALRGKAAEPKTRTIKTMENGVEVEKIVPDVAGGSYPVPSPPVAPSRAPVAVHTVVNGKDVVTYKRPEDVVGQTFPEQPKASAAGETGTPALTPDAIEDTAVKYRILGTNAIPTRIEGPERVRIMNEASKQIRALGQSAAQSLQKAAAFKADGASLTKMQTMADAASASETKALAQADLVGQLSAKVNRSQSPLWNDWLLSGKKKVLGDQDTTLLFNALDTFTSEYAKIISGSTASVAGASDSATRKAEGLISAALNKGTLQATVDQMKWEMGQTIKGYSATIEHINDRLGTAQTPNATAPPPVAPPTGRYNPATGKVE